MTEYPWLDEMPVAECDEGCVVRRGDLLGSVSHNPESDRWSVTILGYKHIYDSHSQNRGCPTPESAGWRHALDHRRGFGHVLQAIGHDTADESDGFMNEMLDRWGSDWDGIGDGDRIRVARLYAAVLR